MLKKAFLSAVITSAGQTSQIEKNGDFVSRVSQGLRRDEQIESHLARSGCGIVSQFQKLATEAGDGGFDFKRHGQIVLTIEVMHVNWRCKKSGHVVV